MNATGLIPIGTIGAEKCNKYQVSDNMASVHVGFSTGKISISIIDINWKYSLCSEKIPQESTGTFGFCVGDPQTCQNVCIAATEQNRSNLTTKLFSFKH